MKQKRKSQEVPVIGKPEDIIPMDYSSLTAEEYMDRQFGPGAWVRDRFDDLFIALDYDHTGPGVAYLVIDRELKRHTVVIEQHQIN